MKISVKYFLLLLIFITMYKNALGILNSSKISNEESVSARMKTNMKIIGAKQSRESDHRIQDRNDDKLFDDSRGIFGLLSIFKHWRSIYRHFRSEIKFVYCITDHFLKYDYFIDSLPTSRSIRSVQYSSSTLKNDDIISQSSVKIHDKSTEKSYIFHRNEIAFQDGNSEENKKEKRAGRSLMLYDPESSILDKIMMALGSLVYVKSWIEDIVDSFGVLDCTRNYVWVLFLRWMDM